MPCSQIKVQWIRDNPDLYLTEKSGGSGCLPSISLALLRGEHKMHGSSGKSVSSPGLIIELGSSAESTAISFWREMCCKELEGRNREMLSCMSSKRSLWHLGSCSGPSDTLLSFESHQEVFGEVRRGVCCQKNVQVCCRGVSCCWHWWCCELDAVTSMFTCS